MTNILSDVSFYVDLHDVECVKVLRQELKKCSQYIEKSTTCVVKKDQPFI